MLEVYFLLILFGTLKLGLRRDRFYLLLFGVVLALCLAEGLCRIAGFGRMAEVVWQEDRISGRETPPFYKSRGELVYRYPDNPRGYFDRHNQVRGRINAMGFRGPDVALAKTPGTTRLAFLGDSFTLGVGVMDDDTLPAQVEALLAEEKPSCQALNFAVSGHNTPEEVDMLERFVLRFDPDIVVLVFFLNDAERQGTIEFMSKPTAYVALRKSSRFFNLLIGVVEKKIQTQRMIDHYRAGYVAGSTGIWRTRQALARANALARERGFKLLLVVYPVLFRLSEGYPFDGIHETIRKICSAERIPYLDLKPAFTGVAASALWVHPLDQHPNELAQHLAARRLVSFLISKDWIP